MNDKRHYSLILIALLAISLSGCKKKIPQTRAKLNNWHHVSIWTIKGKMAINNGQESGSGRIVWQQKKKSHETKAQFKAPLGQGSWEIHESANNATLISSKTGTKKAENAQILIQQELGWDFPWNKLKFWLRAYVQQAELPKHKTKVAFLDENGWHITFAKWIDTPMGLLPKKIKASKPPYTVKLIIYQWNIE